MKKLYSHSHECYMKITFNKWDVQDDQGHEQQK